MSNQILNFYKLMIKDEKFSFAKIINIAKELKPEANYELLENETKALKDQYAKTDFEKVRSKYIVHQDLKVPEIKTNLLTMLSLAEKSIALFVLFSKEFKGRKVILSDHVVKSFNKIFSTLEEWEWVRHFLLPSNSGKRYSENIGDSNYPQGASKGDKEERIEINQHQPAKRIVCTRPSAGTEVMTVEVAAFSDVFYAEGWFCQSGLVASAHELVTPTVGQIDQ